MSAAEDEPASGKRPDMASLVPRAHNTTLPTGDMVKMLQDLAAPWADAEKAKYIEETKREAETTKRLQIEAGNSKVVTIAATVVLLGVLVLAGMALRAGAKEVTEKVLLALIAGASGYVAGRGHAAVKVKSSGG